MNKPSPLHDSRDLMLQLARMANMDMAPIRRMVLVLDIDEPPQLYTEGFIDRNRLEPLAPAPLEVHAGTPVTVSTDGGLRVVEVTPVPSWQSAPVVHEESRGPGAKPAQQCGRCLQRAVVRIENVRDTVSGGYVCGACGWECLDHE